MQGPPASHQGALERHSAVQPGWLGSQMLRGAAGGGAAPPLHPTPKRPQENPLCLLHQAGVGVEFYEHKCQSSRSSANTLWKWPGKQMTKGLVCVSQPRSGCKVSVGFALGSGSFLLTHHRHKWEVGWGEEAPLAGGTEPFLLSFASKCGAL